MVRLLVFQPDSDETPLHTSRAFQCYQGRQATNRSEMKVAELIRFQREVHGETDAALERTFSEAEARAGKCYACRAGCSACCHQVVLCTAAEALLIGAHLRATRGAPELAATEARLAAQVAAAAGKSYLEYARARIPCAFLDEAGRCTIYEVRPLACRAVKSFDVRACEREIKSEADLASHHIPGIGPGLRTAKAVGVGAARELATHLRIDMTDLSLFLPAAVSVALDEKAAKRFLAGEPAFTGARAGSEGDPALVAAPASGRGD